MKEIEKEIIYEDRDLIVCRKTAGIPTQTPKIGVKDMVSILKGYRSKKGEPPYIGLIHRLDQPVEGVMVFAKTKEAAAELSRQVAGRGMDKDYLAVVKGSFSEPAGEMQDYLVRDGRNNISRVAAENDPKAKKAVLSDKVLAEAREGRYSLVRSRLHTGRHRQIRVQMAHRGHPLLGDRKYDPQWKGSGGNTALCSFRIGFVHPGTGKKEVFSILPENAYFAEFQECIGKEEGRNLDN